tara:strand:- start:306 stop:620 length:315 start_codon:yes stop_codon:yes gene_type:complete
MQNVHCRPIKKFSLEGTIYDDAAIWRLKEEYFDLLDTQMRFSGYVTRLDIDREFSIEYNEKSRTFSFKLSVYGVYVGKRKSEWIFGVDEKAVIPIPQSKSSVSF